MTGVSINTVTKLLIDACRACAEFQHDALRNRTCKRPQLEEIWAFVAMKEKTVPDERKGEAGIGSVSTWIAIDADTKLIPSWLVGLRDPEHANAFVRDLAGRIANRVQVTTNGLKAYVNAMEEGFGGEVEYAVLHKVYGGGTADKSRYSPAECVGCDKKGVSGTPDPAHVSTSYIEHRTPEPNAADAEPPVRAADERLQQEAGEPGTLRRLALLRLQLHYPARDAAHAARTQGESDRPRLDV
jgi:hypothetical protein